MEIIRPKITGRGRFSRLFTGKNVCREEKLGKHSRPMLTRGEGEGRGRGCEPFRVEIFNELL